MDWTSLDIGCQAWTCVQFLTNVKKGRQKSLVCFAPSFCSKIPNKILPNFVPKFTIPYPTPHTSPTHLLSTTSPPSSSYPTLLHLPSTSIPILFHLLSSPTHILYQPLSSQNNTTNWIGSGYILSTTLIESILDTFYPDSYLIRFWIYFILILV